MECPLCLNRQTDFFHKDRKRQYYCCSVCKLVFVPDKYHLSPDMEKSRYLEHRNSVKDKSYVRFLEEFISPLVSRLKPGQTGLDFGSGPNPVLAELLEKRGYAVEIYDPYFHPQEIEPKHQFEFITCVETVEHFYNPLKSWDKMLNLLKPRGWLGIKTSILGKNIEFSSWYYKGDPTHVAFYAKETFSWIADHFKVKLEFEGNSEVFFQKDYIKVGS